jgi:WD40 repeat protein
VSLLLLTIAAVTAGLPAGPASASLARAGDERWIATYDGAAQGDDTATAIAVSPDGSRVFVTGSTEKGTRLYRDIATVAYDAVTGNQIWARRYGGDRSTDYGMAIGVSPDGASVFVTGYAQGLDTYGNYATMAFDSATGAIRWLQLYDRNGGYDDVKSLAVSPDGTKVYVTGTSSTGGDWPDYDYGTIAYDATTGAELWVATYDAPNPDPASDIAYSMDVSPDGATVYVTGSSYLGLGSDSDYATVAYDAVSGAEEWVARFDGPSSSEDIAWAIRVAPDGGQVFVTGQTYDYPNDDYGTVAYDASTGTQLWQRLYDGPGGWDQALALAVSPDGTKVVVTGQSYAAGTEYEDFATVTYDAATGAPLWVRRYDGPGKEDDIARSVAISPDGAEAYVTGEANAGYLRGFVNFATIAYDLATGQIHWIRTAKAPRDSWESAYDLAVSPDGETVFVTGQAWYYDMDIMTIAYATS